MTGVQTCALPIWQELGELYGVLHSPGYVYLLREGSYGSSVPDYAKLQPFGANRVNR